MYQQVNSDFGFTLMLLKKKREPADCQENESASLRYQSNAKNIVMEVSPTIFI